jgi:multiple sugar transport system permease protein
MTRIGPNLLTGLPILAGGILLAWTGLQMAPSLAAHGVLATILAVLLPIAGVGTGGYGLYSLTRGTRVEPWAKGTLSYALLIGLGLFLMAPFVWMVLISLHPSKTAIPPLSEVLPRSESGAVAFQWSNYAFVLRHESLPVARFFANTVFVTVTVVLGQLLVASLAAYGFARLRFRGREAVFALFLGSMMFAGPVTQIPVYLMLRSVSWLDTYWALIVPGVSSAFTVFLMRQFFMQIPRELDEAARMDGASDFRIYWSVMLPLSKAALATAAAFTFFGVWTDFFSPLIYTNTTEMRTLEVGLSIFKNSYGGSNWPMQMTAAVIVMAPLLVVFLFLQRYFVRGIMIGSIK